MPQGQGQADQVILQAISCTEICDEQPGSAMRRALGNLTDQVGFDHACWVLFQIDYGDDVGVPLSAALLGEHREVTLARSKR
jgi:hypothetical protein